MRPARKVDGILDVVVRVLLVVAVTALPCAAAAHETWKTYGKSYLAPRSPWEKKASVVHEDTTHARILGKGQTNEEILERRRKLKEQGLPVPMLDPQRKARIAKLIRYYLGDATADLIQKYYLDVGVYLEPYLASAYQAHRSLWDDGSVTREIRIWTKKQEAMEQVVKEMQAAAEQEYQKSGDFTQFMRMQMMIERMSDLAHAEYMLHEIIGLHLIERSFELNDDSLRYGDPVEGEYFEELIQPFLTRTLSDAEFGVFVRFNNAIDDKAIALGLERDSLRNHIAAEGLHKWRGLSKEMFHKVAFLEPEGIDWFEQQILGYYKGEGHYTGKDVAVVVNEAWKTYDATATWPPVLRRDMLKKMAAALGFEDIARKVLEAQDTRKRQSDAAKAARAAATAADMDGMIGHTKEMLKHSPIFRALLLAKNDPDIEPLASAAGVHASREIVISINTLADIHKAPNGRSNVALRFGAAMEMLAARDILYELLGRVPNKITNPREQVRLHILRDNMPEEDARKVLQGMGLIEGKNFALLAQDAQDLMQKILTLRKEEGYEGNYLTEDWVRMNTFFILDDRNDDPASLASLKAIKEKFRNPNPLFANDDPTIVLTHPGVSLGEAIAFGAAMHSATPKMDWESKKPLFKGIDIKAERAFHYVLRWMAATLPRTEIMPLRYAYDPVQRVMRLLQPDPKQSKLLDNADFTYNIFYRAL